MMVEVHMLVVVEADRMVVEHMKVAVVLVVDMLVLVERRMVVVV